MLQREHARPDAFDIVERKLGAVERLYQSRLMRTLFVLLTLAIAWEAYGRYLDNSLLFPTFGETLTSLSQEIASGELLARVGTSLRILLTGYAIGFVIAILLTGIAMNSLLARDYLTTITAMLNPLPAIALLPLALIWFGLGTNSVLFVLVHSVLWPLALNLQAGFESVSPVMRMVGRNYGLKGWRYTLRILIPAAFPSILSGLRIAWAFAWRTLLAAELVFGVSSGSGGIGWFIYQRKNQLDMPAVFSGLLAVVLIGLVIDNLVFRTIEARTVRRWGLQS
ncbi:ABC transporter permease [Bradyrhizobium sp. LHD-71]|uniref:ABC transporter permease n=1 Tax=Bradyrhizobium sp. LHD-71 TaxID=3072141 RepID=UPI00280E571A|nr:ABC transporter permease [Bradyrhizobium sp. LHD-71]MDQ8731970.1 ABC transporter permease [Bradyrhizobium sp. LHD-71]